MERFPRLIWTNSGQSIVQVLVGVGVMSITMLVFMTMQSNQQKEVTALTEKMASIETMRAITVELTNQNAFCAGLFADSNLSNPSDAHFDVGSLPKTIGLKSIPITNMNAGQPVSALSNTLKLGPSGTGIQVTINSPTQATLKLSFDQSSSVRALRDLTFPSLRLVTSGPPAAKQINGCTGGIGGGTTNCPADMTLIGDPGSLEAFCVDSNPRNATVGASFQICAGLNRHFCTTSEWQTACSKVANMQGTWEQVGFFSNWGDHNTNNWPLQMCGGFGLYGSGALNYRCCMRQ